MSSPDKTSAAQVDLPMARSNTPHSQQNSAFPPSSRSSLMQYESGFSEVLGTLHSSPGGEAKWARVVDQLCKLISLSTAVVVSFNPKLGHQELKIRGGADFMEEGQALFNGYYYAVDPFRDPIVRKPLTGITLSSELVPQEHLHSTELHNDILAKYDLDHLARLPLVSMPKHFDVLSAWRGGAAGEFEAEALHLFECALPAAQVLRCELAKANLRAARAEAALEQTSAAAFLLDAAGRVVHMNRSGEAMITSSDGVMLSRKRIIATNVSQQSKLKALIARAISAAQSNDTQPGGAIALERDSGRRPLFVRVLPLRVDLASGHTQSGHALLLITDPDGALKDPTTLLKSLFSLTTAEIAVATKLRSGFTLAEIADVRGVSLETIRSQLKSLLQKTNTRRQSDLILLLTTLIT